MTWFISKPTSAEDSDTPHFRGPDCVWLPATPPIRLRLTRFDGQGC